jgi:hypothetical protein
LLLWLIVLLRLQFLLFQWFKSRIEESWCLKGEGMERVLLKTRTPARTPASLLILDKELQ